MPAYAFEAIDSKGQPRKGVIEADSPRGARAALREQGLVPLEVRPAHTVSPPGSPPTRAWSQARAFNALGLSVWTRQLSGLVAAGLTVERALGALLDDTAHDRQKRLLATLRAEVNAGASFARALEQHPHEFDATYIGVIAAGEESGQLGHVLERLADDLEAMESLKNKLLSAALYPLIVSALAVVIVVFLVTYVVPQVADVFANSRQALPWLTRAMLAVSAALREWGWLLALLALAAAAGAALAHRHPPTRLSIDQAWLHLPLLGRLSRGYNGARFAATLAMLSGAGVPILRALQTAAETLGNAALRADALEALDRVREGASLAQAIAQHKRFPTLLPLFARLGEQTGQLPQMLQRAADQLGAEVQRRALRLATVLEPLLIVAMGLVVMVIVLAVLLPIIQLNQLVR